MHDNNKGCIEIIKTYFQTDLDVARRIIYGEADWIVGGDTDWLIYIRSLPLKDIMIQETKLITEHYR